MNVIKGEISNINEKISNVEGRLMNIDVCMVSVEANRKFPHDGGLLQAGMPKKLPPLYLLEL